MTVRAKFKVTSIKQHEGWVPDPAKPGSGKQGELRSIELSPVYGNSDPDHENTKFYAATPGGSITLPCVLPEAYEQFSLGSEYYVDFTPAS